MTIYNNVGRLSSDDVEKFIAFYAICGTSGRLTSDMAIGLADITLALFELNKPLPGSFHSTSLGETVSGIDSIGKFIRDRAGLILSVGEAFEISSENDNKEAASFFIACARKINPSISSNPNPQETNNTQDNIQVYQADSGEICLKFSSKEARNTFLESYGRVHRIAEQFCKGRQYANNPQGKTPMTYNGDEKAVYFPSYRADRSELAINFGSKEGRNQFLSVLGADGAKEREAGDKNHVEGNYEDIAGKHIFSAYGGTQNSTLYFGRENSNITPFDNGHYLRFEKLAGENTYTIQSCEIPYVVIERARYGIASNPTGLTIEGPTEPTISQLQQSYYRHAVGFFNSGRGIFNPDYTRDEILQVLKDRASRSNSGASASTLSDYNIPFN